MRYFKVLFVGSLLTLIGCAGYQFVPPSTNEDEVALTPAQQQKCKEGGGCITITQRALARLINEAIELHAKNRL